MMTLCFLDATRQHSIFARRKLFHRQSRYFDTSASLTVVLHTSSSLSFTVLERSRVHDIYINFVLHWSSTTSITTIGTHRTGVVPCGAVCAWLMSLAGWQRDVTNICMHVAGSFFLLRLDVRTDTMRDSSTKRSDD